VIAPAAALAVAATLYVSPSGSDSGNTCTDPARPCQTFGAAYRAAAPGATVQAAGGTYPGQTIAHDGAKTGDPDVVIAPAPGAAVTLSGGLQINASHLTIQGLKGTDFDVRMPDVANPPAVSDVTLQDIDGRNFNVFDATDVSILGGDWGPATDCGGPSGGSNNSIRKLTSVNPANIVIDGATIHDVQSYDLNACHIEGLAIFAGQNVIVRNSKFYGNSIYDIFLQPNSGPISGVTLENNWFANPVGTNGSNNGSPLGFSGVNANVTIRNNSLNGIASLDDNGDNPQYSDFVVTGNIGDLPNGACRLRGIQFSYNVWQNDKCTATDVNLGGGAYPYASRVQTAALDYHLTGGPAVDLIPTSPLTRDIDGDPRPNGKGYDAGADELGGPRPPGGGGPGGGGGGGGVGSAPTRTLRFTAIADAALRRSHPRRRGGAARLLTVGRGRDALLKFRVRGVGARTVVRARLRLWVARGSARTLTVRRTKAKWREKRASWRRSPGGGAKLGTGRRLRKGHYARITLKAVGGDGLLGLRLSSRARRGVRIASRSRGKHAPQLQVAVAG
jgi:hypothetical protein